MSGSSPLSLFDAALVVPALRGAVTKLDPRVQWRNPVMFIGLLVGVVALVGVLNYVPALALGPVVEHLQLFAK